MEKKQNNKKIENEELQETLKDDAHKIHMWEPLKFEIKDDYKFIKKDILFRILSNIFFFGISPLLYIYNKIAFGFTIEGKENLKKVKGR